MTNPNRMNEPRRVDPNSFDTVNGRPASNRETARRDGYVQGRHSEQIAQLERERVEQNSRRASESENAFNGLILGILLASGVGLAVAAFSLWYREQNPVRVTPVSPVPVSPAPASPAQSNTNTPGTTQERTVIERTTDRVREVSPAPTTVVPAPVIVNPQPAPGTTNTVPNNTAPNQTVPNQPVNTAPAAPNQTVPNQQTAPNQTVPNAPGTAPAGQ